MIEMVRIRNFKSLGEVSLRLQKFNCLIGMNGAGKSSVLQAFDFLSQLMRGDLKGWLELRGWSAADLNCKLRKESNITVTVEYRLSNGALVTWLGVFNRSLMRCTWESLRINDDRILKLDGGSYALRDRQTQSIAFVYEGSVLSSLKESELGEELTEFRNALQGIRSLELLSPQSLRRRARAGDDIGMGGEKLSAYLDHIKGEQKDRLVESLRLFYPRLTDFKVKTLRSGWKSLWVFEQFEGHKLETEAAHMNDGLLRILAVLTQAASDRSLILLDEIENGINQEIVEQLVDTLVASPQQLFVTTHSPLVLNYLRDEVARESVQFIYKTPEGESRIRRFFDIPRVSDKLRLMGPGDAFVDTNLVELTQECLVMDRLLGVPEQPSSGTPA